MAPTLKIRILQSDWGHHDGSEALKDSRMRWQRGRALLSQAKTPIPSVPTDFPRASPREISLILSRLPAAVAMATESAMKERGAHRAMPSSFAVYPQGHSGVRLAPLRDPHPYRKQAADTQRAKGTRSRGRAATKSPTCRRIPLRPEYRETWSTLPPAPPDALPRRSVCVTSSRPGRRRES